MDQSTNESESNGIFKQALTETTQYLVSSYRKRKESLGVNFRDEIKAEPHPQEINGFQAIIGELDNQLFSLQIWLGPYGSDEAYRFYAGIRGRGKPASDFIKNLDHLCAPEHEVFNHPGEEPFSSQISFDKLGSIIHEQWHGGWHWLGFYDRHESGLDSIPSRFIRLTVDFYCNLFRALSDTPLEYLKSNIEMDYQGIENRKLVRAHFEHERDRRVAEMCKKRDDYRCRACGLKFEERYGELGRGYAEAHHVIPLSAGSDERKTSVDDLVTLCANCHRMVHRMKGEEGDVEKLQMLMGHKA